MKKSLILSLSLLLSSAAISQVNEDLRTVHTLHRGHHNLKMIGDDTKAMIDVLFDSQDKKRRRGYVWKFKKVQIPGIDEPVTLQVHEGIHASKKINEDECRVGSYFNTFVNDKYKLQRIEYLKPNEERAMLIYIIRGKQFGLDNRQEANLVKDYLLDLLESNKG